MATTWQSNGGQLAHYYQQAQQRRIAALHSRPTWVNLKEHVVSSQHPAIRNRLQAASNDTKHTRSYDQQSHGLQSAGCLTKPRAFRQQQSCSAAAARLLTPAGQGGAQLFEPPFYPRAGKAMQAKQRARLWAMLSALHTSLHQWHAQVRGQHDKDLRTEAANVIQYMMRSALQRKRRAEIPRVNRHAAAVLLAVRFIVRVQAQLADRRRAASIIQQAIEAWAGPQAQWIVMVQMYTKRIRSCQNLLRGHLQSTERRMSLLQMVWDRSEGRELEKASAERQRYLATALDTVPVRRALPGQARDQPSRHRMRALDTTAGAMRRAVRAPSSPTAATLVASTPSRLQKLHGIAATIAARQRRGSMFAVPPAAAGGRPAAAAVLAAQSSPAPALQPPIQPVPASLPRLPRRGGLCRSPTSSQNGKLWKVPQLLMHGSPGSSDSDTHDDSLELLKPCYTRAESLRKRTHAAERTHLDRMRTIRSGQFQRPDAWVRSVGRRSHVPATKSGAELSDAELQAMITAPVQQLKPRAREFGYSLAEWMLQSRVAHTTHPSFPGRHIACGYAPSPVPSSFRRVLLRDYLTTKRHEYVELCRLLREVQQRSRVAMSAGMTQQDAKFVLQAPEEVLHEALGEFIQHGVRTQQDARPMLLIANDAKADVPTLVAFALAVSASKRRDLLDHLSMAGVAFSPTGQAKSTAALQRLLEGGSAEMRLGGAELEQVCREAMQPFIRSRRPRNFARARAQVKVWDTTEFLRSTMLHVLQELQHPTVPKLLQMIIAKPVEAEPMTGVDSALSSLAELSGRVKEPAITMTDLPAIKMSSNPDLDRREGFKEQKARLLALAAADDVVGLDMASSDSEDSALCRSARTREVLVRDARNVQPAPAVSSLAQVRAQSATAARLLEQFVSKAAPLGRGMRRAQTAPTPAGSPGLRTPTLVRAEMLAALQGGAVPATARSGPSALSKRDAGAAMPPSKPLPQRRPVPKWLY